MKKSKQVAAMLIPMAGKFDFYGCEYCYLHNIKLPNLTVIPIVFNLSTKEEISERVKELTVCYEKKATTMISSIRAQLFVACRNTLQKDLTWEVPEDVAALFKECGIICSPDKVWFIPHIPPLVERTDLD